jgi:hypothetical protein
MTLSALGIFSAAGAGGAAPVPVFDLLETYILGSSQSSVTFSSLGAYSPTYKHLQIRYLARSSRGVSFFDNVAMRVNADASSGNYRWHSLVGDSSNAASYNGTMSSGGLFAGDAAGNSSTANAFSANVIDILDFASTTKNKTTRTFTGSIIASGFDNQVALLSSFWNSTAAITELRLATNSGNNFLTGSRFSLYGIKA